MSLCYAQCRNKTRNNMLTLKLQEVINMYLPSKNPYIIQQTVINENTQTDQVEVVVLIQP